MCKNNKEERTLIFKRTSVDYERVKQSRLVVPAQADYSSHNDSVAIGKPERQPCKATHRSSKQQ